MECRPSSAANEPGGFGAPNRHQVGQRSGTKSGIKSKALSQGQGLVLDLWAKF